MPVTLSEWCSETTSPSASHIIPHRLNPHPVQKRENPRPPTRAKTAARRLRTKTLSTPSLFNGVASSSSSIKAGSSVSSPTITTRRAVTRMEFRHGRGTDNSDSPRTDITGSRFSKESDSSVLARPWAGSDNARADHTRRIQKLESLNLRDKKPKTPFPNQLHKKCDSTATPSYSGQKSNSSESGNNSESQIVSSTADDQLTSKSAVADDSEADDVMSEDDHQSRRTIEKCLRWIGTLPEKFSSMHIVQERTTLTYD
ncbi:uncharacterized protein LOC131948415 [Physella acuta]|uniref:uncharacterized protein LOC131948415 n=1 Tax=Physella acuta TaxID=109671 RepID=UPI0027DC8F3F|nr:uncharacterized protein LOC131948415 [Physella acuta]